MQKRASEIVQLEESARLELAGVKGSVQVVITGSEVLLGHWGVEFTQKIKDKYPLSSFEFNGSNDLEAIEKVKMGDAHLAFVTSDIPTGFDLSSKVLGETMFKTYLSHNHPLYKRVKNKKPISVHEVLEHSFVSPSHPLLGKVGLKQSLDGWRDDQFPRKIEFLTSSLKILEGLVMSGKAIAYLPEYFGSNLNLEEIKITDCPYTCSQKIRVVARKPKELGWLNQIF